MRFAMWAALVSAALVFPTPSHGAPFSDALVQPPTLAAPQRGTLAGTAARFALGPSDLSRGAFTLPLPLDAPDARGPLLARIAPSYAADAGLGEWGMGWQADLAIRRHRARGEINFLDDDFTSPWGRLVAGDDGAYYPAGLASVVRAEICLSSWL